MWRGTGQRLLLHVSRLRVRQGSSSSSNHGFSFPLLLSASSEAGNRTVFRRRRAVFLGHRLKSSSSAAWRVHAAFRTPSGAAGFRKLPASAAFICR